MLPNVWCGPGGPPEGASGSRQKTDSDLVFRKRKEHTINFEGGNMGKNRDKERVILKKYPDYGNGNRLFTRRDQVAKLAEQDERGRKPSL